MSSQSLGRAVGQFQTGRNRTVFKYSINLGIEEGDGVDALMWGYGYPHKIWGWGGYRYGKVFKTVAHIVHGEDPDLLAAKWKINCHMEYDWWKLNRMLFPGLHKKAPGN